MNVTAIIVTRGDVDLKPSLEKIPPAWEKLIWDNGHRVCYRPGMDNPFTSSRPVPDLAVYGRYAAIEYASNPLIYVQDDDCVVSKPTALLSAWKAGSWKGDTDFVVCNMPQEFRHDFYQDHALVGFGAIFHRDAPKKAFDQATAARIQVDKHPDPQQWFYRTCDVVFTCLTRRVLVDVAKRNLSWAEGPNRMYRQHEHVAERSRMLDLVREVKEKR